MFSDKGTVDSRHLVAFSPPEQEEKLFYYDFDLKRWRPCQIQSHLPYDLSTYRLLDHENEVVVTCSDSYRLSAQNTEEELQRLEGERKWRRDIIQKGAELDFCSLEGWIKGWVVWTKSDIVPGVLCLCHRKTRRLIGYYFHESKKLAKSSTHTHKFTEEELQNEKREEEAAEVRFQEREKTLKDFKSKIPRYSVKGYTIQFYNVLEYYKTLKRYPKEVTVASIQEYMKKNNPSASWDPKFEKDPLYRCFGAFVSYAQDFDVVFTSVKETLDKETSTHEFGKGDAYFGIEIHNATYAKLRIGRSDPVPVFELDQSSNGNFTFADFTYENPLFPGTSGDRFYWETDGDRITYKIITIQNGPRSMMADLENKHALSRMPSRKRWLLTGHLWMRSFCFEDKDLEVVDGEIPESPPGNPWICFS